MRIFSLDSATEAATCAVLDENKLLGEITFQYKKQHSVILMPMVDVLLQNLQLSIQDIDGFVISKGPGSFTGLRIGMATIKGLCHGSSKPFVGVSSLDALAYQMALSSGILCPILDALRDNVYTALYTFTEGQLQRTSEYMAVSIDELITILETVNKPVCFAGDAVPLHLETLIKRLPNVCFAPPSQNVVRASALGELGLALLKQGVQEDLYSFAPLYLRKPQAEREYEKKMELLKHE